MPNPDGQHYHPSRSIVYAAITLLILLLGVLIGLTLQRKYVVTRPQANAEPGELTVEYTSVVATEDDTITAQVVMSGAGEDTTAARKTVSYKIPVTLKYPANSASCSSTGFVEYLNYAAYVSGAINFVENGAVRTFHAGDPAEASAPQLQWPHLVSATKWNVGDKFFFANPSGKNYVYASVHNLPEIFAIWDRYGALEDPTWHLDDGSQFTIMADISRFLRNPEAYAVNAPAGKLPCKSTNVLVGGHSGSGYDVRGFLFTKQNSTRGSRSADFDEGLVYEGTLMIGNGNRCWTYKNGKTECNGSIPSGEGKYVGVESDVEVTSLVEFDGTKSRATPNTDGFYRQYEVAGATHINKPTFDMVLNHARFPGAGFQNDASLDLVVRAALTHLDKWARGQATPPPDAAIQTKTTGEKAAVIRGADGNALGGVRLTHVRTTLPDGTQIGAPLGRHDGVFMPTAPYYALSLVDAIAGMFTPYTAAGATAKCREYYPTRAAFEQAARAAAEYAAGKGWILASDVDTATSRAIARASEYPGCVPASAQ